jgi:transcription-repair coupling factor (superfamily II helicase)
MALYKRVSQLRSVTEVDALRAEIRDRYGALPADVDGLLAFGALRVRSEALGILQADLGPGAVFLRLGPGTPLGGETLAQVPAAFHDAALTPQGVLRIPIVTASRPLVVLDGILSVLEELVAAGGGRGPAAVTPLAGSR